MRTLLALLPLVACTPQPERAFPDGFRFGAATAGFQVEPGCPTLAPEACEDRASDWYAWVTDPVFVGDESLYITGEPLANGPGLWETFEEDVALAKQAGLTTFRLSIEWSRLFPDGAAEQATSAAELAAYADADAVARYRAMLQALRDADIEPMVTVNHYTLPLWVHEPVACHQDLATCPANGWVDGERINRLIGLYGAFVGANLGDLVDRWATLNEPFATTLSGYLLPGEDRSAPPGVRMNGAAVVATLQHQIEGHAALYDALRASDQDDADGDGTASDIGLVMNFTAIHPSNPDDPDDVAAVERCAYLYHRVFLDAVTQGAWDDDLDGTADRVRPELADRLDWLGVNYYNELKVTGTSFALLPEVPASTFVPMFSWEPYPQGMAEVLADASAYGRPVWVTENGTPHVDQAEPVLLAHLGSLADAVDAGADVRGYLYWSWVDNYEWNHGMGMKFGLYALGPNKERVERPVMVRYREIIRINGLPSAR